MKGSVTAFGTKRTDSQANVRYARKEAVRHAFFLVNTHAH